MTAANPFARALKQHGGKDLDTETQQRLGIPRAGSLTDEHAHFLKAVIGLIDSRTVDTKFPQTFLHGDIYEQLSPAVRAKVDRAIPNIATLLERIMDLHVRPEKDESLEMKNLIELLWQAKHRIEGHADVFIF